MKIAPNLPADVISAIQANRKIEAIKLLREARGLGLKEAKHAVDAYMQANPNLVAPHRESSGNRLGLIAVLIFVGYLLYLAFR